jgi:hypothetical protein
MMGHDAKASSGFIFYHFAAGLSARCLFSEILNYVVLLCLLTRE